MAQVSYPGVYIDEFTPGPPIEGVGTSTAAFVGTALKSPGPGPARLHNWEAFQAAFGGFITEQPASYLAPAVYGFFLNGGTDCFVLRASTALHAFAELRGSTNPVLIAAAVDEGVDGNNIAVEIRDSSLLASLLGAGAQPLAVHVASSGLDAALATGAGADRKTITVKKNADFQIGERVVIAPAAGAPPGANPVEGVIESKQGTKKITLVAAAPGNDAFTGGTVRSADLRQGQKEIRVDLPAGVRLDRALPHGTTVRIVAGATEDIRTVETTSTRTGWGTITLTRGLDNKYVLTGTAPTVASLEFDLVVTKDGTTLREDFTFLSMNAEHPRYWGAVVRSDLITLREPAQPPAHPDPDPRPKGETPPQPPQKHLEKGADDDRATAWSNLQNDPGDELAKLDPYGDIDLVCIPGATMPTAQQGLLAYCELKRDRFAILDSVAGSEPSNGVSTQVGGLHGESLGFAALYYPWILVRNPATNQNELWPPSGHVAGVYARTDARGGVHTAPANASLRGALGLERVLSDAEQGPLNLDGVNVLRVFPGQSQPVVWGARTTTVKNRYWQYVNIRRLFLFLEKSIEQNIQWAVFQPNDLALWQQLKRVISDFLTKAWHDGALFGATAKQAFYVRIDEALNPEHERALGQLHIEIGVAPTYPAEFIVVRIGIWPGGSEISEG